MKQPVPLTRERLMSLLRYEPETGLFVRVTPRKGQQIGDVAGCEEVSGYVRISIDGHSYRAHRLAWLYLYGYWPSVIDHINGKRSDNRLANLREANQRINNQNRHVETKAASGYAGVCKSKRKWRAAITDSRKTYHLGVYDTKELAYEAYIAAKKNMHEGFVL